MNHRLRTVIFGAIPLLILGTLVTVDHVPGTDIRLAVPYAAEGPGPTFNTLGEVDGEPVVDITGTKLDDTDGELHMTTVAVRSQLTLAQALGRWLFTDDTLVPIEQVFPQHLTEDEVREMNQQAFSTSEASATIAALRYLDLPVETAVAGVSEGAAAEGVLEINDVLLQVDDTAVQGAQQVRDYVQSKKPGDTLRLKIAPGGDAAKTKDVSVVLGEHEGNPGKAFLGVLMAAVPAGGVNVTYHLEDIGGPSAGMMFSLAVIDKLSEGSLTGGAFIAGTGTISDDGTVGPIGGIVHKVAAAQAAGAELFLAPSANCAEAVSRDHGDMQVVAVDSLEDAIAQIDAYNRGEELRTCS